ncbi:hypothetical protein JTE90_007430 [Oedothorax gibbosus]|uniref:Secreted protein n=1 Tax=Oedothorax gibbosus TaxID=931172 RepID=A0AAV6UPD0_9ARAC|nr:hypothetical protein JTE90_007430 [Oedothorax gibbosus]
MRAFSSTLIQSWYPVSLNPWMMNLVGRMGSKWVKLALLAAWSLWKTSGAARVTSKNCGSSESGCIGNRLMGRRDEKKGSPIDRQPQRSKQRLRRLSCSERRRGNRGQHRKNGTSHSPK